MKLNLAKERFKLFLVFFTIPFSMIKFYAILPLLALPLFKKRYEKVSINEILYLLLFVVTFFGNLIYGKENNFNPDTPVRAQLIICCLIMVWLLIVHFVDLRVFKNIVLFYMLSINAMAFGLIAYTFNTLPSALFTRKFLSPFAGGEIEYIATPAFGNSSGLLLIATIGFLEKKYQYVAFTASFFLSLLLQNRTLMIVVVLASLFIFTKSKDKFLLVLLAMMFGVMLPLVIPYDLISGSFEVLLNRIQNEGLQSERWDLLLAGLTDILSLGHIYGGLDPEKHSLYTYYFHNGILDSYKNFGFVGLFFSTSIVISLTLRLISNYSPYKFLVYFVGVSIFLTSVVFEGMVFEAFTLMLLLSIMFRKQVNVRPTVYTHLLQN